MPENVNWSAVWQSVTDTWLPLFGGIAVIVIVIIVIHFIRKGKKLSAPVCIVHWEMIEIATNKTFAENYVTSMPLDKVQELDISYYYQLHRALDS